MVCEISPKWKEVYKKVVKRFYLDLGAALRQSSTL